MYGHRLLFGAGHRGNPLNWSNPAISPGWDCFDIGRFSRLVAEHTAQLSYDSRQRMVGNSGVGPDGLEDGLFGEQMIWPLDEQSQNVERLWFERNGDAPPLETVGVEIKNEIVKAELHSRLPRIRSAMRE